MRPLVKSTQRPVLSRGAASARWRPRKRELVLSPRGGRVVKPSAMRAFSETSLWNANTCAAGRWKKDGQELPAVCHGSRPMDEGVEESRTSEFVRIPQQHPPTRRDATVRWDALWRAMWRDAAAAYGASSWDILIDVSIPRVLRSAKRLTRIREKILINLIQSNRGKIISLQPLLFSY